MTKSEFFEKLEEKLSILNDSERKDIIDEYKNHIELKMQEGKTEEQAIADFGDVDDLAEEILSAYHINSKKVQTKNGEYYIKKFINFINQTTERLLNFSVADIAKVIAEFLVMILLIALLRIPFSMISDEIYYMMQYMPNVISTPIVSLLNIAFDIVNLIIAFILLYSFAKTRILERKVEPKATNTAHRFSDNGTANFDTETGEPLKKNTFENTKPGTKTKSGTVGEFFANIIVLIIKIMVFTSILLPAMFITIAAIVITVLLTILMITRGIGLWGICIIGAGCCILGIGLTSWMAQLLFGGKKHEEM